MGRGTCWHLHATALRLARIVCFCCAAVLPGAVLAQPPGTLRNADSLTVSNGSRSDAAIAFKLGDAPLLDVGGLQRDPDNELSSSSAYVQGVLLGNGGAAAVDGSRVLFYDGQGRFQQSAGQPGGGPGEFRGITMLCRTRGDTLVVADGALARYTILTGRGEFVRSFARDEARNALVSACFADGQFIGDRIERSADGQDLHHLTVFDTHGRALRTLPPISTAAGFDLVTGARATLVATHATVHVADGVRSEVRTFDRHGRLVRQVRSADSSTRISSAELEEALGKRFPHNQPAGRREAAIARMLVSPTRRESWPVHGAVLPDDVGGMWVQAYSSTPNSPFHSDEWAYFNPWGRLVGRLVFPPPVLRDVPAPRVLSFTQHAVLVRRVDADGALHLTVYPIVRNKP